MNLKPINREELQALFDRFADIPNENRITLLGAYHKRKDQSFGVGQTRYNPNYKYLHVTDDEGKVLQTIPTVKVVVKIPSDTRVGADGSPFITNIPLFATDGGVEKVKALDELSENEIQYVICEGAVQNFYVTRHASPNAAITNYLNQRWMMMYNGKPDNKLANQILQTLRMSLDVNDNVQLPMLNVWIHQIADGTEIAEDLRAQDKHVGINEANVTGLVYMPPSLRLNSDGKSGRIHFKVRVKREDVAGQTVPIAQQSKEGYDIINVLYSDDNIGEYFEKVRQGYPVKLRGSLENYKFVRKAQVNLIEQRQLAELFGTDLKNPAVQDIVNFVDNANIKESIPSYNILAKEIRTDYQNW